MFSSQILQAGAEEDRGMSLLGGIFRQKLLQLPLANELQKKMYFHAHQPKPVSVFLLAGLGREDDIKIKIGGLKTLHSTAAEK